MSRAIPRKDILLSIIVSAHGNPISPIQLQKIAFLVGQQFNSELPPKDYYEFVPYDYGPFCKEIYTDAINLEKEGYVQIEPSPHHTRRLYRATYSSRDVSFSHIPPELQQYIEQAVEWAMDLSFRELVSSIYKHYPEYGINSIFSSQFAR